MARIDLSAWKAENTIVEKKIDKPIVNKSCGHIEKQAFSLMTKTFVHIGSGEQIGKLDSIVNNGRLYIINATKLMQFLLDEELVEKYTDYVQSVPVPVLNGFVIKNNINVQLILGCCDHSYEYAERSVSKPINTFVKTSGNPYIPGSSLKGSLLTALSWYRVKQLSPTVRSRYFVKINEVLNDRTARDDKEKRLNILQNKIMDEVGFNNSEDRQYHAYLSGVRVSDSTFIDNKQLAVKDKFSLSIAKGIAKSEGTVCEYLKPDTTTTFSISLDKTVISDMNIDSLIEITKQFTNSRYQMLKDGETVANVKARPKWNLFDAYDRSNTYINIGRTTGLDSKIIVDALCDTDKQYTEFKKKWLECSTPVLHKHGSAIYSPRCLKVVGGYSPGWCLIEEID